MSDSNTRKALEDALRWLGIGGEDDPNATFEDIADWYYRETGHLRPGKSVPMQMAYLDDEERRKHFAEWCKVKSATVRANIRKVLA